MDYAQLRLIHVSFALLSLAGFVLRGLWMLRESPLLQHRLSRTLPHVLDTLLLIAGIFLVVRSGQMLWNTPWLGAKLLGLLAYISLGRLALGRGHTRAVRHTAWVAAIAVFIWMLSVARLRSPLGFVALLLPA